MSARKPKVVATYSVLGDLVRNVGGEHIELTVLVGPGQDTHTFEPVAANGVALSQASLLFENGLGFETWLDDLVQSSGSKARRIKGARIAEVVIMGVENCRDCDYVSDTASASNRRSTSRGFSRVLDRGCTCS